jgi:putative peptide zinc metalloprotease protein
MNYDYLQVKKYESRMDDDKYVLSFSKKHHIKISQLTKTILDSFNDKNTLDDISANLRNNGLDFSISDLQKFVDEVLIPNSLLTGQKEVKNNKSRVWLNVPIVESDKLHMIFDCLKIFFEKPIAIVLCLLTFSCVVYNIYIMSFTHILNGTHINIITLLAVLCLSLVFHEFGHISAVYHYNIHAGKIGFGLYLIFPVLYVDMTNAWRLDNKKRVVVDFGGMYFQLLSLIPLTLISIFAKDSTCMVTCLNIIIYTFANLNPLFKLDGYWILSDYFKLDNLSSNAFGIVSGIFLRHKLDVSRRYKIGSLIYVISTVLMMIFGIYLSFNSVLNINQLINKINVIFNYIINHNFSKAISISSQLFSMIIPFIFIGMLLVSAIKIVWGFLSKLFSKGQYK